MVYLSSDAVDQDINLVIECYYNNETYVKTDTRAEYLVDRRVVDGCEPEDSESQLCSVEPPHASVLKFGCREVDAD